MNITTKELWQQSTPWIDQEDVDIDEYASKYAETLNFDLAAKLKQWRNDGLVIFEQASSHTLIDALVNDIDYLREHYRDFELFAELKGDIKPIGEFTQEDLAQDGVKFNSIHSISLAAAQLSLTYEISTFLKHVFRSPACVMQSLTFYKGSQQPTHIDYPYVRCQTLLGHLAASWIALEDIHPDSGPLAYYMGSHNTDISGFFDWGGGSILYEKESIRQPHEFSNYLEYQMKKAGLTAKAFCPKKGDILIWHGNLVHAGTSILNSELTRKSYVTHYTSKDGYPALHKRPNAKPGSGLLRQNGGYCFEYPWLTKATKLPSWVI